MRVAQDRSFRTFGEAYVYVQQWMCLLTEIDINLVSTTSSGVRQHRHLVDRARRRHADAAAIPAEAAPHLEELQDAHLHRRADGGQLYPDEERP